MTVNISGIYSMDDERKLLYGRRNELYLKNNLRDCIFVSKGGKYVFWIIFALILRLISDQLSFTRKTFIYI